MRKIFSASFLALLLAVISPGVTAPAWAALPTGQCAMNSSPGDPLCPTGNPQQAITTPTYDAVKSNQGLAGVPIDVLAYGKCRYVDNNSGSTSFFVPFKTSAEWLAFIANPPPNVTLTTCARPATLTITPNASCVNPSPATRTVSLPYARTGTVIASSVNFTCETVQAGCPTWTQTAQVNYTALNSDVATPSWSAGTTNFSGNPPDPSTCTTNGACGSAHGVPRSSAPSSGLCSVGSASAVTGSGPWNWTCAGTGGGSNANCTAPLSSQAGVCGPANGVAVSSAPSSGLCTTGTPTAVAGGGPWTWTCTGIAGGANANCSAPLSPPVVGAGTCPAGSHIYVGDAQGYRIRKIAGGTSTGAITIIAGTGVRGFSGDGGPATSAKMDQPVAFAMDGAGNLYFADFQNLRIRKITASTGIITTFAGTGTLGYSGDGGPATSANLNFWTTGLAVDAANNLYIADDQNHRIRKVNASTGIITTIVGTGTSGFSGDGGPATSAKVNRPVTPVVDSAGNIYFADDGNRRIRKVTASTGIISTIAGTGVTGYGGDGGPATSASFDKIRGLALDTAGNLYISEQGSYRIRKIAASTGIITTIAGTGVAGYSGDGGPATSAQINQPVSIVLDSAGLYIGDSYNYRVRKVGSTGIITTISDTVSMGSPVLANALACGNGP